MIFQLIQKMTNTIKVTKEEMIELMEIFYFSYLKTTYGYSQDLQDIDKYVTHWNNGQINIFREDFIKCVNDNIKIVKFLKNN